MPWILILKSLLMSVYVIASMAALTIMVVLMAMAVRWLVRFPAHAPHAPKPEPNAELAPVLVGALVRFQLPTRTRISALTTMSLQKVLRWAERRRDRARVLRQATRERPTLRD